MKRKVKLIVFLVLFLCLAVIIIFKNTIRDFADSVRTKFKDYHKILYVNFDEKTGEIKQLNGINNGPKNGYSNDEEIDSWELDVTRIYQKIEIPFVRTHDSEYPYGQDKFIDIHCIFPDFSRDAEDPSAYNFTYTDKYVEAIIETGAEVFFRLGESIDHSGNNLYINPPEDYEKWAQICEHIIRHYNEGWAEGYHYDIKFWEIWNEPDNSANWTGTMDEYSELYRTTASYLKKIYPDIYVGGYAAASCSEETISLFLQYLQKDGEKAPLDFFSWHTYTSDPAQYMENAVLVRNILDENGYKDTISILDEWNYVKNWDDLNDITEMVRSVRGASFIAGSLITMQYSPVDMAMYYDGQFAYEEFAWCGLYEASGKKLPGYYIFQFFNELYQQENQVRIDKSESLDHIYALAVSGEKDCILLTNYSEDEEISSKFRLSFNGEKNREVITRVNEDNPDGEKIQKRLFFYEMVLDVQPGETIFIELE